MHYLVYDTQICINQLTKLSKKAREFQKNIYFCFIDYAKAFDCVDHNKLWEILKEMGIPDHLTCLLRNLYAGQEATVKTRQKTMDWLDLLVVQGTLKSSSTPQFKSINSSALSLPHSPTLTSIHDHRKNHSLD